MFKPAFDYSKLATNPKNPERFAPPSEVDLAQSPLETRQEFLNAMSRRVSTVNLVVTDGSAGRFGLTVTCMCSISADPPMVMIGINRKSPLCDAITGNGCFVINVLSVSQKYLADSFSGGGPKENIYDFSQATWQPGAIELPILEDGTAAFECDLASYQDAGSHRLFMGNVLRTTQGTAPALCYSERSYKYAEPIG